MNMSKKPQTQEELIKDIEQHSFRGKVAGESIADISTVEYAVLIEGNLYNQLIQIRGALGLTKGQVAQEATFSAFRYLSQLNLTSTINLTATVEGKSYFRGNTPKHLYERTIAIAANHGLDKRQVSYLGLYLFANDAVVLKEYERFIQMKTEKYQCERSVIEEALYGLSKALSRQERLKLIIEGDADSGNSKMKV